MNEPVRTTGAGSAGKPIIRALSAQAAEVSRELVEALARAVG
jgi:hypothetical protein